MPVHYRRLSSVDEPGVPILDYEDYLIDFLWDGKRRGVLAREAALLHLKFVIFGLFCRAECHPVNPRGHARGRNGGGGCREKAQVRQHAESSC